MDLGHVLGNEGRRKGNASSGSGQISARPHLGEAGDETQEFCLALEGQRLVTSPSQAGWWPRWPMKPGSAYFVSTPVVRLDERGCSSSREEGRKRCANLPRLPHPPVSSPEPVKTEGPPAAAPYISVRCRRAVSSRGTAVKWFPSRYLKERYRVAAPGRGHCTVVTLSERPV